MQFANPLFLAALATLVIPVLIHLFNFRRFKKVYFTNVRFLQEIEQETKKQSRLRQLLILAARLLALAALVIAFAQPYIPASRQQKKISGQRAVSIYIDNSFSMEALATEGKLIDQARERALEIASAYSPSDLFNLVTNDFEGRHQRFVSQEEFKKLVQEVQVSPATRSLADVMKRQSDLLTGAGRNGFDGYVISDFQKTSTSLAVVPDTALSWFLLPLKAEKRSNLFIDTAWFQSPVHQAGQPVRLHLRIRNTAGEPLDKVPVKLSINSIQKALSSFAIGAQSSAEITLSYTENSAGIHYGMVELTDYPVVYDDKFYFSYSILPSIPVLCLSDKGMNPYLDALFTGDSTIQFTHNPVKQVDYGRILTHSLVILNSPDEISSGLVLELNRYVRSGGHLVIFPPAGGNPAALNALVTLFNSGGYGAVDTLRQRIASLNTESELYAGVFEKNGNGKVVLPDNVDFPMVFRHYNLNPGITGGWEVLIRLQNNRPFLVSAPVEKGRVWLFSSPPDEKWTLFPKHMIFVPTLYKIALLSTPSAPLYHITGREEAIAVPGDTIMESNLFLLKKQGSGFEIIPEIRRTGSSLSLFLHNQVRDAGFYSLEQGKNRVAGLAFNYDRKESDLDCYSPREIENQVSRLHAGDIHIIQGKKSSLVTEIRQIRQGTPLWKAFIALALLFLAAEIALIRFLKQR
jgi:hypothetical protein